MAEYFDDDRCARRSTSKSCGREAYSSHMHKRSKHRTCNEDGEHLGHRSRRRRHSTPESRERGEPCRTRSPSRGRDDGCAHRRSKSEDRGDDWARPDPPKHRRRRRTARQTPESGDRSYAQSPPPLRDGATDNNSNERSHPPPSHPARERATDNFDRGSVNDRFYSQSPRPAPERVTENYDRGGANDRLYAQPPRPARERTAETYDRGSVNDRFYSQSPRPARERVVETYDRGSVKDQFYSQSPRPARERATETYDRGSANDRRNMESPRPSRDRPSYLKDHGGGNDKISAQSPPPARDRANNLKDHRTVNEKSYAEPPPEPQDRVTYSKDDGRVHGQFCAQSPPPARDRATENNLKDHGSARRSLSRSAYHEAPPPHQWKPSKSPDGDDDCAPAVPHRRRRRRRRTSPEGAGEVLASECPNDDGGIPRPMSETVCQEASLLDVLQQKLSNSEQDKDDGDQVAALQQKISALQQTIASSEPGADDGEQAATVGVRRRRRRRRTAPEPEDCERDASLVLADDDAPAQDSNDDVPEDCGETFDRTGLKRRRRKRTACLLAARANGKSASGERKPQTEAQASKPKGPLTGAALERAAAAAAAAKVIAGDTSGVMTPELAAGIASVPGAGFSSGSMAGFSSGSMAGFSSGLQGFSSGPPVGTSLPLSAHPAQRNAPAGTGSLKIMHLPIEMKAGLIGRGGQLINHIRSTCRSNIQLNNASPNGMVTIVITGNADKAEAMIMDTLNGLRGQGYVGRPQDSRITYAERLQVRR